MSDRITQIRERAESATPGPWRLEYQDGNWTIDSDDGSIIVDRLTDVEDDVSNLDLAAHAREDIPYLLSEVDRLRAIPNSHDELEQRLWKIIDADGLANFPSDIADAVFEMNAEIDRLWAENSGLKRANNLLTDEVAKLALKNERLRSERLDGGRIERC